MPEIGDKFRSEAVENFCSKPSENLHREPPDNILSEVQDPFAGYKECSDHELQEVKISDGFYNHAKTGWYAAPSKAAFGDKCSYNFNKPLYSKDTSKGPSHLSGFPYYFLVIILPSFFFAGILSSYHSEKDCSFIVKVLLLRWAGIFMSLCIILDVSVRTLRPGRNGTPSITLKWISRLATAMTLFYVSPVLWNALRSDEPSWYAEDRGKDCILFSYTFDLVMYACYYAWTILSWSLDDRL